MVGERLKINTMYFMFTPFIGRDADNTVENIFGYKVLVWVLELNRTTISIFFDRLQLYKDI